MRKPFHYLKPFDYLLIACAIIISFIPFIITTTTYGNQLSNQLVAQIKINGEIVDRFALSENTPHQEIYYTPNAGQYNIVEIDGTRIRIKEDNSPDQIGVRTGWISAFGQIAVCLPHQFIIEITGAPQQDDIILPLSQLHRLPNDIQYI